MAKTTSLDPAAFAAQADAIATFPKPTRKDGPSGRFYEIDGERLPSVTHILQVIGKPALINWAANQERTLCLDAAADFYLDCLKAQPMSRASFVLSLESRIGKQKAHKRELDKAGEIGSQAHALIEWNLRQSLGQRMGPEPRVVDAAQWAFMAFQDWANSVALKPLYIEQTVFSKMHGYAGTMDLLALVNGVPTLIDFKTGKAIYAEAHLQNVAYQSALVEMGHAGAQGGLIVRLPKVDSDPEFETAVVPPVADLLPVFLSVKRVWVWWFQHEEAYRQRRAAMKETA
jgi:hypothetical protein